MRLTWIQPEDLLLHEFVQARREGVDTSAFEREWAAAGGELVPPVSGAADKPASDGMRALARRLLDDLDRNPAAANPLQPDGLERIEATWRRPVTLPAPGDDLLDRLRGAWTGRAAGCLLGKPVEKIPRRGVFEIASATGNWPVRGYFTAIGLPDEIAARWPWNRRSAPTSLVENIDGMPEDDDLNYPIMNLGLLERFGSDFTTSDVAQTWLSDLPAGRVFTAERAAYRNLLNGVPIPETARVQNPFREWIGALIRGDVFGWIHPGDPIAAARLAWRDARLSHTQNGVYAEMWAAALASASLVADRSLSPSKGALKRSKGIDEILTAAESVIPGNSELARAVRFGAELGRKADLDQSGHLDQMLDALHAEFGQLHWVHSLNNAATIAAALTSSGGDFTRAIGVAVMAGWDTDSAGATVGSILGGLLGAEALPAEWTEPLGNRVATTLPGGPQSLDDLAARTHKLAVQPRSFGTRRS